MLLKFHDLHTRGKRRFVVSGTRRIEDREHDVIVSEGTVVRKYIYPAGPYTKFGSGLAKKAIDRFLSEERRK
jgi:hypothetical protein